jgi:hypothetical protein
VRALIRKMAHEKPLWGAPRIHGELLKLGVTISQATVAKYLQGSAPPSQSWRAFLVITSARSWPPISWSSRRRRADSCSLLVLLAHERLRIVHVAVTHHPTAT